MLLPMMYKFCEAVREEVHQWHSQNILLGVARLPNHDKEINKIMHKKYNYTSHQYAWSNFTEI